MRLAALILPLLLAACGSDSAPEPASASNAGPCEEAVEMLAASPWGMPEIAALDPVRNRLVEVRVAQNLFSVFEWDAKACRVEHSKASGVPLAMRERMGVAY